MTNGILARTALFNTRSVALPHTCSANAQSAPNVSPSSINPTTALTFVNPDFRILEFKISMLVAFKSTPTKSISGNVAAHVIKTFPVPHPKSTHLFISLRPRSESSARKCFTNVIT